MDSDLPDEIREKLETILDTDLESYISSVVDALTDATEGATDEWMLDFTSCVGELSEVAPARGYLSTDFEVGDELKYRRYKKQMDSLRGKYGDEVYQLAKHAYVCEGLMAAGVGDV